MSVKIVSVEPTAAPDQLVVRGKVGKEDVSVTVWKSHLYGDKVDPNAKDKSGRYHRAPDLGGAKAKGARTADSVHAEVDAGPRDPEVPQTDAQRKAYLRTQLEAAVPKSDSKFSKLTD